MVTVLPTGLKECSVSWPDVFSFFFFFSLESNNLFLLHQDVLQRHTRQSVQCIKYKTTTIYRNFFNCGAGNISNMNWKKKKLFAVIFFMLLENSIYSASADCQDNSRSLQVAGLLCNWGLEVV